MITKKKHPHVIKRDLAFLYLSCTELFKYIILKCNVDGKAFFHPTVRKVDECKWRRLTMWPSCGHALKNT